MSFFRTLLIGWLGFWSIVAGAETTMDFRPVLKIGYIESSFMPSERRDVDETFAWLRRLVPQYRFEVVTYSVKDLESAIKADAIDFFLGASGFYRRVYFRGLRDLATMTTPLAPNPGEGSGTAFLVPVDSPIKTVSELRGKRAATSWSEGFTGVFIPLGEVLHQGFNPDDFFTFVIAGSPMTNLLKAVERGEADVALARACSYEVLQREDPTTAERFRVVGEKENERGFRCRRSTALYPNWTFVSTKRVTWEASRDVTVALLAMPPTTQGAAWGVVSDFAAVDNLYKDLRAGPYSYLRIQSLSGFVEKYRGPLMTLLLIVVGLALHSWRAEKLVVRRTEELKASVAKEKESEARSHEAEQRMAVFERVSVVGAMSSLITHELNGPIAVISNSCSALERWQERNDCPEILKKSVQLIERQCERVTGIVEKVRSYARNRERALVPVDVRAVAERVMSMRRTAHPGVHMALQLPEYPLVVLWDELECELVLNNLVKNAAQACRGKKNADVQLTASSVGDSVRVEVTDNADTEEVSLRKHAEPLNSGKPGGLGLGLLIVRTLTEKISGHFSIERRNGKTVAWIVVPAVQREKGKHDE